MENIMNIDPVHLAFRCTAEGTQKILNELEAELAEAKVRRDKILVDIGKANDAAFAGDRRARLELSGLNKQDAEVGRLILSIERQVAEAKKRSRRSRNRRRMTLSLKPRSMRNLWGRPMRVFIA
jgi:hypothetical protein